MIDASVRRATAPDAPAARVRAEGRLRSSPVAAQTGTPALTIRRSERNMRGGVQGRADVQKAARPGPHRRDDSAAASPDAELW